MRVMIKLLTVKFQVQGQGRRVKVKVLCVPHRCFHYVSMEVQEWQCTNMRFLVDHKSAGFLAFLSAIVAVNTGDNIIFDKEEYDYGNNYDPVTGKYTVRYDGLYLVHARLLGNQYGSQHRIMVDGVEVAYSHESDSSEYLQSSSTSITLHLQSGQELAVHSVFDGTVLGHTSIMYSSLGATLLYGD